MADRGNAVNEDVQVGTCRSYSGSGSVWLEYWLCRSPANVM